MSKLPAGYDQVIGRRFRAGVDLSGGEWQKIARGGRYKELFELQAAGYR